MRGLPEGPKSGRVWSPVEGDRTIEEKPHNAWRFLQDADGNLALFKYLRPGASHFENYTLGIEWTAYALGTVLGIPVAPVYLERFNGTPGVLSPWLENSMSWWLFRQRNHKAKTLTNSHLLPLSAVFDVWIANCDRWEKNVLVQADPPRNSLESAECLSIWLIDHGVSMLWPGVKFGLRDDGSDLSKAVIDNGDTEAEKYIRDRMLGGKNTRLYWHNLLDMEKQQRCRLYEKVKEIDDATIEGAVNKVPGAFMSRALVDLTVHMLKARRDRVDDLVERLLEVPA